jgi:hypothetical protein
VTTSPHDIDLEFFDLLSFDLGEPPLLTILISEFFHLLSFGLGELLWLSCPMVSMFDLELSPHAGVNLTI